MTLEAQAASAGATRRGETRFVTPAALARLEGPLAASGLLVVRVEAPGPAARGALREVIESAIEDALARRGAPPPGVGASSDLDASLSDQLYRARHVGATGIAVCVPPLEGVLNLARALDAEDSAVLRWYLAAASERPLVLLLDEHNRAIGAYGPPTRLDALVVTSGRGGRKLRAVPRHGEDDGAQLALPLADDDEPVEPASADATDGAPDGDDAPEPEAAEPAFVRIVPAPPTMPPTSPVADHAAWAAELDAARGPKPLAAIERLFVSRYVPLAEAVATGAADGALRATLASWSASVAKSYSEAFGALRVTGKRPLMVLDAPALATRIARLHGAKSTQLLVVDGMRFDLGLRVHERLRLALGQRAACTERMLLWAALPTTTDVQADLLARGQAGLASMDPSAEREDSFARGRAASTLRRVKVGPRSVLKLDLVEARSREPGPPLPARLDALADEVSASIAAYARTLQPRTLVFLFGDHGFLMPSHEGGTGPATQGGASPEEVLVPAYAWLVGGLH